MQIIHRSASQMLEAYDRGLALPTLQRADDGQGVVVPAARLAEAQTHAAPVFTYRFDRRSNFLGELTCHVLDIGFAFGTDNKRLASALFGTSTVVRKWARDMTQSWIAFATTGDPSTFDGPAAHYDAKGRPTMIFGDGPHIPSANQPKNACARGTIFPTGGLGLDRHIRKPGRYSHRTGQKDEGTGSGRSERERKASQCHGWQGDN
jgi:carboxylesterase type B